MSPSIPPPIEMTLTIAQALDELRAGEPILVTDDDQPDGAGSLLVAAQFATPKVLERLQALAGGVIRLALSREQIEALGLPTLADQRFDKNPTAFTSSITAPSLAGSSSDSASVNQARTIQRAIHPQTQPHVLSQPGSVYVVQALPGGILKRAGYTEAAIDLTQQAGLYPAGVLCEVAQPESWDRFCETHQLRRVTLADLIAYQVVHRPFVQRESIAGLPSDYGQFRVYSYRDTLENKEHLAMVKGDPTQFSKQAILVRIHSECLTGDSLGSLRCDCRRQLEGALKMIEQQGEGVVVYLRQEGRGIGLINKLKAYSLQDLGLDTVEANQRLGFAPDLRNYGVGAQILRDLGVRSMRLITNNPRKISGLKGFGLEIAERVPLLVEENDFNQRYLATKAEKLGHLLLRKRVLAIGLYPQEFAQITDPKQRSPYRRAIWVNHIRQVAAEQGLLVQEDTRPIAALIFGAPGVVVHVGFELESQGGVWYRDSGSPLTEQQKQLRLSLLTLLIEIHHHPELNGLAWMMSEVHESLSGLSCEQNTIRINSADLHQWHQQISDRQVPELAWQERTLYYWKRDSLPGVLKFARSIDDDRQ